MLKPATPEAFKLMMEGAVAFARIEAAGIKINVPYLDKAIQDTKKEISEAQKELEQAEEYKVWARTYGNDMNLRATQQLGTVIFDILGHKRNPFMYKETNGVKRFSNDIGAFEHLKLPFIKNYQKIAKLRKALVTYLMGIKRETVNGYVHPFQSLAGGQMSGEGLGGAESYRSSSQKPNFHNIPTRDKRMAEIIRSCVMFEDDEVGLEMDFGSHEVRMGCIYTKDKVLLDYILGGGDMHKDIALRVFKLTEEELGPYKDKKDPGYEVRSQAKNKFTFLENYGGTYFGAAPKLWDCISLYELKTAQGLSLHEHLHKKGIKALGRCLPPNESEPVPGTFEFHLKQVEDWMWKETFKTWDAWKRSWWDLYQLQGGVNTLTGFKMEGVFRRNQVLCNPIQGSAFHCLLWTIIQLQKYIIKHKAEGQGDRSGT
jgi:hypothetical protein